MIRILLGLMLAIALPMALSGCGVIQVYGLVTAAAEGGMTIANSNSNDPPLFVSE